ncbi:MAG: efflux RND transporter periplasmic adaptor subunit [Gammaproteobacteria bacterium]|nr:MAG: efflux RND transporter periplasmic adaptor subunit [Gammaproteobacteria bacterium]
MNAHTPFHRRLDFWLVILIIAVTLGLGRQLIVFKKNHQSAPPTAVVVAKARTRDVPVYLSALGSVTPTRTITVRTQINGQLIRVLFHEGQMVKAGDVLAEIDPRPYEAQLLQYEGQLLRDQALLDNALVDLKRYKTLWRQDSVSQQTYATQQSLVKQYQGTVKTDQGLIEAVKVNLIYCRITSPTDGRIGLRLVDPGNVVQVSDTNGIAVVTTLNPITVLFSIPEDNIPEVMEQINAGKILRVEAFDRQQNEQLAVGRLVTLDNQIDPTTGTVKLRAIFDNAQNRLFPSQFVNIQLLVNTLPQATVVPTAAVQNSTKGAFVYVLNKDSTVSTKPITVGVTVGDDTVITSGVSPGQSVVVMGGDNLVDGAAVITDSDTKRKRRFFA